jgi:hypothetical protein
MRIEVSGHGLAWLFGTGEQIQLRYVWHDAGCEDPGRHVDEIVCLQSMINGEIDLVPWTVAELVAGMDNVAEPVEGYRAYLVSRYLQARLSQ